MARSRYLQRSVSRKLRAFVLLPVLLAGCGSASKPSKPSASSVEDTVRPELRSQLHDRGAGLSSLACIVPSKVAARCVAKVSYQGSRQTVAVQVTIDPDTGKMIWETAP